MTDTVSVKYIGARAEYTDGAYGTRIQWARGESKMVPADKARQMLKHHDVYCPGDTGAPTPALPAEKDSEEDVQDLRDSIANMSKESVIQYAQTNFNIKMDKRQSVESLRTAATQLIDQFGALQ
jgi:hypothetical protein